MNSPFVPHSTTRARAQAKRLFSSLLLKHPCDMDIEDIAWSLGIAVREADIHGCDGRLMRQGGRGIISIKASILETGKKRFTIAHEIGHFDLHDGQSQLEICSDPGALSSYLRDSLEEKEANAFAIEFLLPESMVKPMCHSLRPDFDSISKIAKEFNVTFTAAALRFVELTSERCALVFSHDSRVSWAKRSPSFGHFLERETRLSEDSHAIDFFQGTTPPKQMTRVFAEAWFKAWPGIIQEAQMYEQSLAMEHYRSVLTLLWLDNEIEDTDYRPEPGRARWHQDEDAS